MGFRTLVRRFPQCPTPRPQLILKKTTETMDRLSYLDMQIDFINLNFRTSLYDKRDRFKFHIVNFPHMDNNIPTKLAYGVYISKLVRIGSLILIFINLR